jgi:hypothetical protein
MSSQAGQALRKDGRVLTQPQHVFGFQASLSREILHGLVGV